MFVILNRDVLCRNEESHKLNMRYFSPSKNDSRNITDNYNYFCIDQNEKYQCLLIRDSLLRSE